MAKLTLKQHFANVLVAARARRSPPESDLEALIRHGYTPAEIMENVKRLARGQSIKRRAKGKEEPKECRKGKTGFKLCVYDVKAFEVAPEREDKYTVVCEEHNTLVNVASLADARNTDVDDFCDDCRELLASQGLGAPPVDPNPPEVNLFIPVVRADAPRIKKEPYDEVMLMLRNVPYDPNTKHYQAHKALWRLAGVYAERELAAEMPEYTDREWEKRRNKILASWGMRAIPAVQFDGLGAVETRKWLGGTTLIYTNRETLDFDGTMRRHPLYANSCFRVIQFRVSLFDDIESARTLLASAAKALRNARSARDHTKMEAASEVAKLVTSELRMLLELKNEFEDDMKKIVRSGKKLDVYTVCFHSGGFVKAHELMHAAIEGAYPLFVKAMTETEQDEVVFRAQKTFLEDLGPAGVSFYGTYAKYIRPERARKLGPPEEVMAGLLGMAYLRVQEKYGSTNVSAEKARAAKYFNTYLNERGQNANLVKLQKDLEDTADAMLAKYRNAAGIIRAFSAALQEAKMP